MDEQLDDMQPMYTQEDLVPPADTNTGDYSILKAVSVAATQNPNIPDEIDFNSFLDDNYRSIVDDNNNTDYNVMINAASSGNVSIVDEAMNSIRERNRIMGESSANNATIVKTKIKELADKAVENIATNNNAVMANNSPEEIAAKGNVISNQLSAQAVLEKSLVDAGKWATGLAFELTPFAALQGPAMDKIANKYGASTNFFAGRSETVDRLIVAFQAVPDEEKGQWADNLLTDLKDSFLISDWQAGILVSQIITQSGTDWAGFSDWADRLGAVGVVVGGAAALTKAGKLVKTGRALVNAERTLATAGAKDAIVAAEAAKIASAGARAANLQAAGVVVGELTGVSAAIDLAKLVSMSAAKVLPEAVSTAANNLQKVVREPVEKLIDDLQATIAGKGIRAEEAATQLATLEKTYSKAENPTIHTVDPFVMSADGTAITGRVLYKPADASSFLTKEAAEKFAQSIPGSKVVPDTTNSGFLVEESYKQDLLLRKRAAEAKLIEALAAAAPKRTRKKKAPTTKVELAPPRSLETSKPRYKTNSLQFDNFIDKAAYQVGSKTKMSKSDEEVKVWLQSKTGWSDAQIKVHAAGVREHVKGLQADELGNIKVEDLSTQYVKELGAEPAGVSPRISDAHIAELASGDGMLTLGNLHIQKSGGYLDVVEFINRLGKALGMENRTIIVLDEAMLAKSSKTNATHKYYYDDTRNRLASAVHYDTGNNASVIVMKTPWATSRRKYMEAFAHEYGHAFEVQFSGQYFDVIEKAFERWLGERRLSSQGTGLYRTITSKFPLKAMMEYRGIMSGEDLSRFIDDWYAGNLKAYEADEKLFREWARTSSEFFAENFAKWAFTDKVPTDLLGQYFKKLVDGFKLIVETVVAKFKGTTTFGQADPTIARMLNEHIMMAKAEASNVGKTQKVSASLGQSPASLQKEIEAIDSELEAIEAAEKGIKTGWLVEKPVAAKVDYAAIGKYTDDDIDSFSRFALGDWALSTSSELYAQRVVGIHQQSRYTKLLTNFVRPSIERLNKAERVALDNALVLGDKEGKVWSEAELSGLDLSKRARDAYYRVRALRDVMWQVRNDVAAKSLIRRGFSEIKPDVAIADVKLFGKEIAPTEGKYVYNVADGKSTRISASFLEDANKEGLVFYELAEPLLVAGKYRKTIALKTGSYDLSKPAEVIPYRAGEYRRIYSDEYFVKIRRTYDVDGVEQEVVTTHRTAASAKEANEYIKAMRQAQDTYNAGKLDAVAASRALEAFGWKPEEAIKAFDEGAFEGAKFEVVYNRMDDDYVNETIGLSSSFASKRGDKVLSVRGEDTVNTLSPLDSIAAEIGNTSYVASTTEWREANVIRWFNTFKDDLPSTVGKMSPEEAFVYMLNNEGMYVGQSKRLSMAQKVQEYIISQLNITTKEEKQYLGAMRLLSESIEGVGGGNKVVSKLGMFLRASKDYPTWARTVAFHSFFAFNPVQFFMQGMNAFNAVAISPIHGMKSAQASAMYSLALMSDQETIWRQVAKANKLGTLGLGMNEDEFVAAVRSIRRSGLLDGLNTSTLYGAETGKYGMFNGLTRKAGAVSAAPFNAGEGYARLVSFDIARREYIAANPGSAWWADDALAKIIERQDDLTQNMTKANVANWQRGWKSIPTQFIQYQVKLMMNIVQSLLGNKRVFTRAEAARLLVAHTLVMGTSGSMMFPFAREIITELLPEDLSETQRVTIQQGILAGAIAAFSEGEAKLAIGSRFNTFRFYEDLVQGILDPEKNILEVVGGPSGFAAYRLLGGVGQAMSIVAKAPMTMGTLQVALTELGKSTFTAFNNVQKARIAMANYNQVMSGAGGAMYQVTDTEAWMMAFGIPPVAQEDLSIMYESSKAHSDDIKASSKVVGYHAMMAITALNTNDMQSYETHAAIVQAVLNAYTGSDLRTLMTEAYKVEGFTQYEKMLVDKMMKEWEVGDVLVDLGVNE